MWSSTCHLISYCTHSKYVPGVLPSQMHGRHQYSMPALLFTKSRHSHRSFFNTTSQVIFCELSYTIKLAFSIHWQTCFLWLRLFKSYTRLKNTVFVLAFCTVWPLAQFFTILLSWDLENGHNFCPAPFTGLFHSRDKGINWKCLENCSALW